jgi:hypothetical protein
MRDGRTAPDGTVVLTAAEAMRYLTPGLLQFLADMHGAPMSIVQAAVQVLPFGSRSALITTGLCTTDGSGNGPAGEAGLRLTPLALEVMAEAAAPAGEGGLDKLADAATAIVAEHSCS